MPPTAPSMNAVADRRTSRGEPPVRSEKAGVSPIRLIAPAATSGAATVARTAMVSPSSTNTTSTCGELPPRLLSSTTSLRRVSTTSEESVAT